MKLILHIALRFSLLLVAAKAHGQITDSQSSAEWLAAHIASNEGATGSMEDYMQYSRSLAKTLSMLPEATQAEVLGTSPPAGGGDGGEESDGGGDGGGGEESGGGEETEPTEPIDPLDALEDDGLSPFGLLDALLNAVPLSDPELKAALERVPPMNGDDLADLFYAQGNLSNGLIISSLVNSSDNLSSENLKDILINNAPLSDVILKKVEGTTKMTEDDKTAVFAANSPSGGESGGGKGKGKGKGNP